MKNQPKRRNIEDRSIHSFYEKIVLNNDIMENNDMNNLNPLKKNLPVMNEQRRSRSLPHTN